MWKWDALLCSKLFSWLENSVLLLLLVLLFGLSTIGSEPLSGNKFCPTQPKFTICPEWVFVGSESGVLWILLAYPIAKRWMQWTAAFPFPNSTSRLSWFQPWSTPREKHLLSLLPLEAAHILVPVVTRGRGLAPYIGEHLEPHCPLLESSCCETLPCKASKNFLGTRLNNNSLHLWKTQFWSCTISQWYAGSESNRWISRFLQVGLLNTAITKI